MSRNEEIEEVMTSGFVAEIRRVRDELNSLIEMGAKDGLLVELNVRPHTSMPGSFAWEHTVSVLEIRVMRRLL